MTSIYLASRYSRRLELCGYRAELEAMGHTVTSRWLDGNHQLGDDGTPISESGEALIEGNDGNCSEQAARLREHFAQEDLADIESADVLIAFTEPPRSSTTRGGRHVELGFALALNIPVYVVGHRENVFCWLPDVKFFGDWQHASSHIANWVYVKVSGTT